MREACTKACAIDVVCSALGNVDLLAARAKNLKAGGSGDVADADGQNFLLVAESARAITVAGPKELLEDLSLSSLRCHITRMNQPVKIARLLVKLQETLVLQILLVRCDR